MIDIDLLFGIILLGIGLTGLRKSNFSSIKKYLSDKGVTGIEVLFDDD